jgi:hypothetical protein
MVGEAFSGEPIFSLPRSAIARPPTNQRGLSET